MLYWPAVRLKRVHHRAPRRCDGIAPVSSKCARFNHAMANKCVSDVHRSSMAITTAGQKYYLLRITYYLLRITSSQTPSS